MATIPLLSAAARDVIISIEVGPEKVRYSVHKSFLMHHSQYFRNSLSGQWKEAESNVIQLVDIEPAIFNIFINWLYRQSLPKDDQGWVTTAELGLTVDSARVSNILKIKLYVFADRFQIPSLRKALQIEIANRNVCSSPSFEIIIYAFDNLRDTDPIILFLVDSNCMFWDPRQVTPEEKALHAQLPPEYLLTAHERYGMLVATQLRGMNMKIVNACEYHEHENAEEKQACEEYHQERFSQAMVVSKPTEFGGPQGFPRPSTFQFG